MQCRSADSEQKFSEKNSSGHQLETPRGIAPSRSGIVDTVHKNSTSVVSKKYAASGYISTRNVFTEC